MSRARDNGVERFIAVSGTLEDSHLSAEKAEQMSDFKLFASVGVHPTRCSEFDESGDPDAHLLALSKVVEEANGKVVAIGEIGLDYDREQFCPRDVQQKYFLKQLELAERHKLPVIFHNRNTSGDFERMVKENREKFSGGIVHSFTGTKDEMHELVSMGLLIGINGCSLKTTELLEMIKDIPLDNLVLETDAPWCNIRNSHASSKHVKTKFEEVKKEKFEPGKMVKDRCEPSHVVQVAEVIAAVKGLEVKEVANAAYLNTMKCLFPEPN
mmetsp:Transcript_11719/g.18395  ORF Transcript_11719/g.18395 Transcript_11719/m.18395 type:complete len:269 (-) Transcript_11719:44-850(-)